jgi:hypothetical protein
MTKKIDPLNTDDIIQRLEDGGVTGSNFYALMQSQADPVRWLCDAFIAVYSHNQELRRQLQQLQLALTWNQDATLPTNDDDNIDAD